MYIDLLQYIHCQVMPSLQSHWSVFAIIFHSISHFTLKSTLLIPQVYCDMLTDDGGWTVIQRRQDGSQDFFLNWNSYVAGFGDKAGEHWLGFDKIFKLANEDSDQVQLRIDMTTDEDEPQKLYARYKSFYIGDASTHYTLQVSNYIGDAGDSLGPHNTHRFSTKDNGDGGALLWNGAWWFHNTNLHSHLNGEYDDKEGGRGVVWWNWAPTGFYHLTFTEMKVRRKY